MPTKSLRAIFLFLLLSFLLSACVGGSNNSSGGISADPNQQPVANAGEDQNLQVGGTALFDGALSQDPDGSSMNYQWSLVSKPAASTSNLNSAETVKPTLYLDAAGVYTVSLVVSDGELSSVADTVIIRATATTPDNRPPVSNAGADLSVNVNQETYLDGSGSYDPDGDTLHYQWSVDSAPDGASVQFNDINAAVTVFSPSMAGIYVFELLVSDAVNPAVRDTVRVEVIAVNQKPVANAGEDQNIHLGDSVSLDATASSDADNDALNYQWALVSRPADSHFVLTDADKVAESFTFTPDTLGLYHFSLTVNDGSLYSETVQAVVYVNKEIVGLDYRVVDAEYSLSLDKIIMVAAGPNRLFVYDPLARTETEVELPLVPNNVSVSPDGLFAAVGHDAWVSYIDLADNKLKKTISVSCNASDIVLAGNGYIYVSPKEDQWERLRAIHIETEVESLHTGNLIYDSTQIKLHPDGQAIYGADRGLSPSDLEKYDISGSVPNYLYDSPYHGDYDVCGDLWVAQDGLRVFTRCGNVFRTSGVREQDMTYNGSLDQLTGVQHLSHSSQSGKVVVIPRDQFSWYDDEGDTGDGELQIYDYQYLAFEERFPLPNFIAGNKGHQAHGRFVFHSADGEQYFVIVQADEASGMLKDYGVITY